MICIRLNGNPSLDESSQASDVAKRLYEDLMRDYDQRVIRHRDQFMHRTERVLLF